jgi:hypothetical protein
MLSIAHGRYPTCQKVSGILPDIKCGDSRSVTQMLCIDLSYA